MPELPEVETIRRQLAAVVLGATLDRVEVLDPRWGEPLGPDELSRALTGRVVEGLQRRGKYLIWRLADDVSLLMHLRMTGTLLVDPSPPPAHTRALLGLSLSSGPARTVAFVDPRRFGTAQLAVGPDALEAFIDARLGIEPFDPAFTAAHLRALTRGRRAPIKALLLDQRRLAGVGNIYADEALFRARIHPLRPSGRLTGYQHAALRDAIVATLQAGIDARGATIGDFRHVDGVQGAFQDQFLVHRRAGQPCPRCGAPVVKLVAAGRGTYVCPVCQSAPRRRARRDSRPATG